jgi:hypothetical protein
MLKYVTTEGSILIKTKNLKKICFSKTDRFNTFAWKSLVPINTSNRLQKFEKFKNRFLIS